MKTPRPKAAAPAAAKTPARAPIADDAAPRKTRRPSSARARAPDAATAEPLARYRHKRDFGRTPEPPPHRPHAASGRSFVIQKHWASRLHYDFRLELDGVLLSWAVPKGPSVDPKDKRMAVRVEDHPVDYGGFEGEIPKGQYGAGRVIVWDRGSWEPVGDPRQGLLDGKLVFRLHGEKLAGLWELVRIRKPEDSQDPWMLFKKRDAWARARDDYDVIQALPDSVLTHPLGPVEQREPRGPDQPAQPPADDLSAAVSATLPANLKPQLATPATEVPAAGRWLLEPKWDGYRLLARVDADGVRLLTRNGHDWTRPLGPLAQAVAALDTGPAWLDGEIVVLNEQGVPDFNRLQNAIDTRRSEDITYFLFDLPFHGGLDLRAVPLATRRARLQALVAAQPEGRVRFSADFDAPPAQMLQAACAMKLEGLIAKRADAPYVSARTETWLKLKCSLRQEFVVVGFHDRAGSSAEVGSLLLATRDAPGWRYAGSVGTGWGARQGQALHQALQRLATDKPAVDPATVKPGRWSSRAAGGPHWVKPRLVVEVSFSEWTPEGRVRHPVFRGVRSDQDPRQIVREPAVRADPGSAGAVRITHPERVVDPASGLTKRELVRYYEAIAERMLPHLRDRPVSLVRAPDGLGGQLFFQKHPETRMPGLSTLDPALWPGHAPLLAVQTPEALVAAAQMNVIELHTWNATTHHIDHPDRVIFDLDPGEGVPWPRLREAAQLVREMLALLDLQAWLKTSGGKGLHVVVPLQPVLPDTTVKAFSQAMVEHLARTVPQRLVAKSGPANRIGKVYVDYLRNGRGQTTVAAFSARARPGLGVSMPVSWQQLPELKSGAQWTVATAREYLSFESADPWAAYGESAQRLDDAMHTLGVATA